MDSFRKSEYYPSPKMQSPRTPRSASSKKQRPASRSVFSTSKQSPFMSPFSSFSSLRNQNSSFSFQNTQIIEETAHHVVESYGTTLPVLVTEALTMVERGTEMSIKLSNSGWVWLVCGRRLFVWRYKQHSAQRSAVSHCRELKLPPSDLAHKADLVCILVSRESQMPGVISVSPEGIARYWPNIAHEGSYVESPSDLQGQECCSLTNIQPLGCILATTTSSLILLFPTNTDGQNVIQSRILRIPQGVLAGIGRRVSSFIFGPMPNQSSESKQLVKVLSEDVTDDDEAIVYVLTRSTLQKWHLIDQGPDRLLYEIDLERPMKEKFLDSLWNGDSTYLHQLKCWAVDMQLSRNGVLVLMAGLNAQVSPQLHYAFGELATSSSTPPSTLESFCILRHTERYQELEEEQLLGFRFILPLPTSTIAYVYNATKVMCISAINSDEEPDVVEFGNSWPLGDILLGAGTTEGLPLFFSNKHGLIALVPTASSGNEVSQADQTLTLELSVKEAEVEEMSQSDDKMIQLKAALYHFCLNDMVKCHKAIDDIFPASLSVPQSVDSTLDMSVGKVSEDIVNDYPSADPRWAESIPPETSAMTPSLILTYQLEDKTKVHKVFVNFLKRCDLWDRLQSVTVRGSPMTTRILLCEHAEKLAAAMALRELHQQYNSLLEMAIKRVLHSRGEEVPNKLTAQDVFYRDVASIDGILPALFEYEEAELNGELHGQDIWQLIVSVNDVFLAMLQSSAQYRQTETLVYGDADVEYVPWTSTVGPTGVRTLVIKQHTLTVEHAGQVADDMQARGRLHQQLVDLADVVLDGYRSQLESVKSRPERYRVLEDKYTNDRRKLILPLLRAEQYERAAALAEKYCDFGILVELCEETDCQERLNHYMVQFGDKGFADFAFGWYLNKGKKGKLLSQTLGHSAELATFLTGHDNLSWLHRIYTGDYWTAHDTLKKLGLREEQYLSRKKTLLSLSKLTALASDEPVEVQEPEVEDINEEQELILYQETLPTSIMEACGYDPDTMKVLSPYELIQLYTSDENTGANEYDFKKALDLIGFMKKPLNDPKIEEIRLHIWCQAILRDSWEDKDTDCPLESMRDTNFFRIIELALTQGCDMTQLLPPVSTLIHAPALGDLANNPSFAFLVQAAYEHVRRLIEG